MVDGNGSEASATQAVRAAPRQADTAIEAYCVAGAEAISLYSAFCGEARYAPPQDPRWVGTWAESCKTEIVTAVLESAGQPLLALALEVTMEGPIRVARFVGGTHANGNFPAIAGNTTKHIREADIRVLLRAIGRERNDIDLVKLERQVGQLAGIANPLLRIGAGPSPNPALAVDLSGGFDAVLSRTSGKRKRKKHRSQTRKFEAAGGFRRVEGQTRAETDRLLDAFFEMKSVRFAAMGIHNVFADAAVQRFFRELFGREAGHARPGFVLHGLEVGGKLRAVTGSSITEDTIICEFGSIAEDDLAFASPGDFLFFENIREACEMGLAAYDFSVGDEAYKRLWCDIETPHHDVLFPLSAKGHAAALARRTAGTAKRLIKGNPLLWQTVKRLRRSAAGKAAARSAPSKETIGE